MTHFCARYCAFVLSCWAVVPLASGTMLFRCTAEDGAIEFRQHACSSGIEERFMVRDVRVGWQPPEVKGEKKKRVAKKAKKPSSNRKKKQQKTERACFNKRQQLERVEWRLKRGYKASKGNELRMKRRQYEEYLDKFC